jgi:hypothetical protein
LEESAGRLGLLVPFRRDRYEPGDEIEVSFKTLWPEVTGCGRFRVERYAGSGFAGQVYRCRLLSVSGSDGADTGLREGGVYALKVLKPVSRGGRAFRDLVYRIGFQSPFSAEVNEAACRAGLLWQRMVGLAAREEFGRGDAIAEVYASFYDPELRAWGEIREWVEGRQWRLEADPRPGLRRQWRSVAPGQTCSPEYVAKRQFMDRLVRVMRDIGADELSRQYVWWTMKSQPNVLKRDGNDADPAGGLCAVDFRAGLALLPFLPMSPADIILILRGLARGSWVQFDRARFGRLREWARLHPGAFAGNEGLLERLEAVDGDYRASMPDVTHQGFRLCVNPGLRLSVRMGLIEAHRVEETVDEEHAGRLAACPGRHLLFWAATMLPFLGRWLRHLWGNGLYRRHVGRCACSLRYFLANSRANIIRCVIGWHRAGRVGEPHARRLASQTGLFWIERLTVGFLPAGLHRLATDPGYWWSGVREWFGFMRRFYRDATFRQQWLQDEIEEGRRRGMLTAEERAMALERIEDPFIAKYLKCVAVHLATLPVSEIFWGLFAVVSLVWAAVTHLTWEQSWHRVGAIMAVFLLSPVSPGSLVRGFYVIYLIVRERAIRPYLVAAPISFLKIVGYLAFPIQMAATHPVLSSFMASRWATDAVHVVPVFGEKGALLEHAVFDLFFNIPQAIGQWARGHVRGVLGAWMAAGLAALGAAFWTGWADFALHFSRTVNLSLAVLCLNVFPRVLFYPLLRKR